MLEAGRGDVDPELNGLRRAVRGERPGDDAEVVLHDLGLPGDPEVAAAVDTDRGQPLGERGHVVDAGLVAHSATGVREAAEADGELVAIGAVALPGDDEPTVGPQRNGGFELVAGGECVDRELAGERQLSRCRPGEGQRHRAELQETGASHRRPLPARQTAAVWTAPADPSRSPWTRHRGRAGREK